ncbi:hypothetical protein MTO96_051182 [Rhipicephalus appendiculatus]
MTTLSGEMSNSSSALMEGTEDAASIDFGDVESGVIRKPPRHRMAAFFHLAFRTTALLTYLLCRLFTDSFGRLLVGLRWWNYVDDAGKSHWVFESRKAGEQTTDASEASLFWMGLIGAPVLWTLFFFVSLFSWNFQIRIVALRCWCTIEPGSVGGLQIGSKEMVTMIALALNGANLYGYIRCRLGSKGSMKAAASNFFGQQLLRGMFSKKEAAPPCER